MTPPFTTEQFLDVFKNYNEAVFPAQGILYLLGLTAAVLVFRRGGSDRIIAAILAAMWIWTGAVYFLTFFTAMSPGGYLFGGLYLLQGMLLAPAAWTGKLHFSSGRTAMKKVGWALIIFAMALYPLLGRLLGHHYPEIPTFGLPCPLTIFTFGLFLLADHPFPKRLLAIPALWALVGSSAVVFFGVYQDTGLLLSAIVALSFLLRHDRPS